MLHISPRITTQLLSGCLFGLLATTACGATTSQPLIAAISPLSGGPGTLIDITGTGLAGITRAWVGSGHDAVIENVSSTEVRLRVPNDATSGLIALGNGVHWGFSGSRFSVNENGQTAITVSPDQTQPVIAGIAPTSGPVGSVITVTGSGLQKATVAWIGGAHDAAVQAPTDTSVKITVPADAKAGQIALQSNSLWAFSTASFTVTGVPTAVTTPIKPVVTTPIPTPTPTPTPTAPKTTPSPGTSASTGGSSGSGTGTSGTGVGTPNPNLAVKVQGNHLIDASGNNLQLRGVNVSGLEFVAIAGWIPSDPWGGGSPNYNAIRSWHANTVRIPLNEASWLGYTCTDITGASRNPDPGNNYKATVANTVAAATAAGFYVILDLHLANPAHFCPLMQNEMADTDNSITFWTSVASQFKQYPNVLFELFNEPFFYYISPGENAWSVLQNGGTSTQYVTGGNPYTANYTWTSAGMQQLLTAVRSTGATNVVLVGANNWSSDLSQWVAYKPTDPIGQMGAVWHAYPASKTVGDPERRSARLRRRCLHLGRQRAGRRLPGRDHRNRRS